MKTITSVEAQNNFGALMDHAMRGPITITKHGKPRVVMVAYSDEPIEFGEVALSELSPALQQKIHTTEALPRTAFRDF